MRDTSPPGNGTNTESNGDPSKGSAGVPADSSTVHKQVGAPAGPKPYCLLSEAPATPTAGGVQTGDSAPADAVPGYAPETGSIFGFRKALKSAVSVLTKERSFARDETTPSESELQANPVQEFEQEPEPEESPETRQAGLSGHTSAVAIPEVLGFLAQLRKSGTLWIWNHREQFRIQLVDGNVIFARDETPQRGWLLGEVLISQGAIDAARFEAFMKLPREPGPLGDALIKAGLIDKPALAGAIQFQAQRVFNRAYGLEDAYFGFDANRGDDDAHGIKISVTSMLFESARTRDESEQRLSSVFDDPFG